jgi:hypothetical protein
MAAALLTLTWTLKISYCFQELNYSWQHCFQGINDLQKQPMTGLHTTNIVSCSGALDSGGNTGPVA